MVGPEFRVAGSVVRITLQDFMTYRHETIWPGPAFNVTVGPNGSGKSSIVTALAICLGGDLQSLNRQSELGSLVNTEGEAEFAVVEVELWREDGRTTVVRAEIPARGGGVQWSVDKTKWVQGWKFCCSICCPGKGIKVPKIKEQCIFYPSVHS